MQGLDVLHEAACLPPPTKRLSRFAAIFHPSVSLLVEAPALIDLQEILREQGRTISTTDSNSPTGTSKCNRDRDPPPPSPVVPRKPRSNAPTPAGRKQPRCEKGRTRPPKTSGQSGAPSSLGTDSRTLAGRHPALPPQAPALCHGLPGSPGLGAPRSDGASLTSPLPESNGPAQTQPGQ